MIQRLHRQIKYQVARIVADAITAPLALITAYCLKFKLGWFFQNVLSLHFGKIYEQAQIEPYLSEIWVVTFIWIITFAFVGVYRPHSGLMPDVDESTAVIKGVTLATIELMAFTFIYKSFPGSRFVIGYMWGVGITILLPIHALILRAEITSFRKTKLGRRVIVIGNNATAHDIIEKLVLYPTYGLRYIGSIKDSNHEESIYSIRNHLNWLGDASDTITILTKHRPEVVLYAGDVSKVPVIKEWCGAHNIDFAAVVDIADVLTSTATIIDFDGIPMIQHKQYRPNPFDQTIKTLFDRVLAILGLIILSPVFAAIGLLIKWVSPNGPILYHQERLTQDGATFQMIKFRTMVPNAERESGPVMVNMAGDSRYIKYGAFLRKTSLDELPQLINVLKGEMSLVGPRPERPSFTAEFSKQIPHFHLRLLMKGGITGWAQINGRSALTAKPEFKIKYDLYYIKNWSLIFDIKILIKTIWIVLVREEAY